MRVSVIIPLFNKAPFVERALASVAAQTFTDFEVIVINDGSTDEGPKIVKMFADARVQIVEQDNLGPGAARNRGIAEAHGEFVAFLDADDEWLPEYLSESVQLLDENKQVATATSGYFQFPSGTSSEGDWRERRLSDGVIRVESETDPMYVVSLLAYMSPCTTVARADIVRKWGGFYAVDHCTYAEDAHLWLKMLMNESVIINLKPLARIHFEASSATQTRRAIRPIEPFLIHPEEIEANCPPYLHNLLARVLTIRALKTASMLGYWGKCREARDLVKRFPLAGSWRLPYYTSSLVCRTALGSAIGKFHRTISVG